MSLTLALDTTGRGGQFALARAGELIGVHDHDESQGHAESLFGLVDALLRDCSVDFDAVDRLAVVRGPGSFTGLRIGIMSAKGWAFARSLPLYSAATLPLLASAVTAEPLLALQQAGGDHVFAQAFAGERALEPAARVDLAALRGICGRHRIDVVAHAPDAKSQPLALALGLSRVESVPLGVRLALCASLAAWPCELSDPTTLVPEYLALSQAERTHGLDLSEQIHAPGPVEEWE